MKQTIELLQSEEFGTIRVVRNEQGDLLFCGRDVAKALGYKKPENAIAAHVDDENKTSTLIQGNGSNYKSKTIFINESGLYSLILRAEVDTAKRFAKWVTSEVLPSIRRTGGYMLTVLTRVTSRLWQEPCWWHKILSGGLTNRLTSSRLWQSMPRRCC